MLSQMLSNKRLQNKDEPRYLFIGQEVDSWRWRCLSNNNHTSYHLYYKTETLNNFLHLLTFTLFVVYCNLTYIHSRYVSKRTVKDVAHVDTVQTRMILGLNRGAPNASISLVSVLVFDFLCLSVELSCFLFTRSMDLWMRTTIPKR